jgi:hypothetical protein
MIAVSLRVPVGGGQHGCGAVSVDDLPPTAPPAAADQDLLGTVDLVVTLGRNAAVDVPDGVEPRAR